MNINEKTDVQKYRKASQWARWRPSKLKLNWKFVA